jgi:peptidoglycan/LPS O-acetylase OafA/YrhL
MLRILLNKNLIELFWLKRCSKQLKVFNYISLKRKTNSTHFIPEIDGLRFFAIITVVLFHLNSALSKSLGFTSLEGINFLGGKYDFLQLGWWVIRLDLGVKVFFAISGFVLALPFVRNGLLGEGKPILIKDYFIRRLTRLEPPFLVSLMLFTMVHVFLLDEPWVDIQEDFWSGLFYLHGIVFGAPNPINPVTWSLEVEAQFYVLVPLLFLLVFRFTNNGIRIWSILALAVISIYLKGIFTLSGNQQLGATILAYFTNFSMGILFAFLFVLDKQNWLKMKSHLYDFLGFGSIFLIFYFYKPQHIWCNNVIFNLGVLLMMISSFKGIWFNYFFTRPWVYVIGGMCYSIYLLHYAFFHFLVPFTSKIQLGMGYKIDYLLQIIIAVPIMLVVTTLFYLLVERPCMDKDWPKRLKTRLFSCFHQ